MVKRAAAPQLTVGATVHVPWGLDREVEGTVLEVWGDPPQHVRVELHLGDDDEAPTVLLLASSSLTAA